MLVLDSTLPKIQLLPRLTRILFTNTTNFVSYLYSFFTTCALNFINILYHTNSCVGRMNTPKSLFEFDTF